ncbi:MAG: sterol desaturase [Proteobacteria bacterium]|nr:MAG: sterol desaturase [Pseudomonadota bacterium]
MPDFIVALLAELSDTFLNPKKRVFIGYLLCAGVISMAWLLLKQRHTIAKATQTLFSREVWLSRSAKIDYSLLVLNKIIMMLISPLLLGQLAVATFFFESMHYVSTPKPFADWSVSIVTILFTVVLFLLDDATKYLVHRWMHQSRILWRFHQVHHTATNLTPLTIFRAHPVEGVMFSLRSTLVQGACIGSFVFLFGSGVDLVTVFGVNVLLFLFNVTGSNLRHSPVGIPYPNAVERWLISPAQHHIHHSTDPAHYNKNYGVVLSVWDRLGGTLYHSEPNQTLDYGILQAGRKVDEPLWCVYLRPFWENWQRLALWLTVKFGKSF